MQFQQPDTVIPETSQGVLAWNRYAYTNFNPLKFNDPSGHFAWIPILAGVGAITGAGIYLASTAFSHREFSTADLLISVGVGAAGGALIGTGVGAGAGVAAFAAIGAGAGVLGGQAGYSFTSGKEYDSGDMIIASAASGLAGAVTGAATGAGITGTTATIVNTAANGGASTLQYSLTELNHGRNPTTQGAVSSGLVGAAVSYGFDSFVPSSTAGQQANYWLETANLTKNKSQFRELNLVSKKLAQGKFLETGSEQSLRSAAQNVAPKVINFFQQKVAEWF